MSKNISLQFQNIAAGLNDARYSAEGSTQFFVSQSPDAIYNDPRTNIEPMIRPLLDRGSDVVSFSEVFGKKQRDTLKKELEKLGYTVHVTDAFHMWSQSMDEEHLYNVVGYKKDKLGSPDLEKAYPFHTPRPVSGVVFPLRYILSGGIGEGERGKLGQTLHLSKRLMSGILDGAISIFEFDRFTLATGHVHRFNKDVRNVLQGYTEKNLEKPFVLIGDMNVPHGRKILTQPPFNTPDWETLIHKEHRTFGFTENLGLRDRITLATAHMQPDVLVTRGFQPIDIRLIQTPSDHAGIEGTLNPTSQSSQ